jgi:hypothetical protein
MFPCFLLRHYFLSSRSTWEWSASQPPVIAKNIVKLIALHSATQWSAQLSILLNKYLKLFFSLKIVAPWLIPFCVTPYILHELRMPLTGAPKCTPSLTAYFAPAQYKPSIDYGSIFWDIKSCIPLEVNRSFLTPASCWFLAWHILRPWRRRRHVWQKRRMTTRHYIPEDQLFTTAAVRTSNPTSLVFF